MTERSETTESPQDSAIEIGSYLRDARLQAGMTLGQVASSMRLTESTVERLESESGDFSDAPVYLRGYMKNYAKLLGVDLPQTFFNQQVVCPVDFSAEDRGEPRWRRTAEGIARRSAYLVATGLVVGTLLAWLYDPSQGEGQSAGLVTGDALDRDLLEDAARLLETEEPARRAQAASMTPLRLSPEPVTESRTATSTAPILSSESLDRLQTLPINLLGEQGADEPAQAQASNPGYRLLIRATADSWTSIENNGERLVYDLINAGSERIVELQPGQLRLLFGYAPGIELRLNDQPLDLAAHTSGDVARLQIAVGESDERVNNGAR